MLQWMTFYLFLIKGLFMTNEEIGKELNMHPKAVDSLYRRASAKFNKKLKERFGESITLDDILPALSGKGDYDEQMSCM